MQTWKPKARLGVRVRVRECMGMRACVCARSIYGSGGVYVMAVCACGVHGCMCMCMCMYMAHV